MRRIALIGFSENLCELYRQLFPKGDLVLSFKSVFELKRISSPFQIIITSDKINPNDMSVLGGKCYWMMTSRKACADLYAACVRNGVNDFVIVPESLRFIREILDQQTTKTDLITTGLTPTENKIMEYLSKRRSGASKSDLIELLWDGKNKGLDPYLSRMKKKLIPEGYRLIVMGGTFVRIEELD
jgi:hypothetical protein